MKRRITLFALFLLINGFTFAQATGFLQGAVTDKETEEPIAFANVELAYRGFPVAKVQTDRNGKYKIKGINPGTYSLRVSGGGIQSFAKVVIAPDRLVSKDIVMPSVPKWSFNPSLMEQDVIFVAEEMKEMPDRSATGVINTVNGIN